MTKWIVGVADTGLRLDAWLAARPEIGSRGKARDAIACGKVYLNEAESTFDDAGRRLARGDRVGFWPDRPGSSRPRRRDIVSARRALAVVYEDEAIAVVNKAPGWLVEPLPGEEAGEATLRDLLEDHLRHRRGLRPLVVHRIDRDTSGLVLFALTRAARDVLKAQFERRAPARTYLAILNGRPIPPSGTWRDRLVWDKERLVQKRAHAEEERAKDAEARYRVVEQLDWQALVEVSLVTGSGTRFGCRPDRAGMRSLASGSTGSGARATRRTNRSSAARPCTPPGWRSRIRSAAGASSSPRRFRMTCSACSRRCAGPQPDNHRGHREHRGSHAEGFDAGPEGPGGRPSGARTNPARYPLGSCAHRAAFRGAPRQSRGAVEAVSVVTLSRVARVRLRVLCVLRG